MPMRSPEILAPAGNLEKLRFAVDYGADAVYGALDRFGMRASADNFSYSDFAEGLDYAHRHGAKFYCTLNTMPHESDFRDLPAFLSPLADTMPDAFIVSDIGVMECLKQTLPNAVLHLSTQASTVNSAACSFWYRYGVRRIVLARELSLQDIRLMRERIPKELELEAFVHGAMCVSYSGRCLLSNFFTGRNANEGKCAQPCRWEYHAAFYETKRPNDILTAAQDTEGTYLFSSRDLCMLEHLDDLLDAGIDSFKIEGRMKSAYYAACVVNAYRLARDHALAGRPFDPTLLTEVEGVTHREYCTGYFYGEPRDNANIVSQGGYLCEKPFYGTVLSYDAESRLARCYQRNKLTRGAPCELLSPGQTGHSFLAEELFDTDGLPIESTPHPKMEFLLRVENARAGDIIRGA